MEIAERELGDHRVVGLTGRLDLGGSEILAERLHELIDAGQRRLIIEGQALDYISSAGLRVLLVAAKRLKTLDGRIVLASVKPNIKEALETAGFKSILPIYDNADQAAQKDSMA